MAKVHGVAGEWARVKGMVTGLWPLFLGVFAAGFAVAVACVFLCSPAAAYIHGAIIPVDGGWLAR